MSVKKAWDDLGYRVRPIKRKDLFVLTEEPPKKVGSIWLPNTITNFWYGPSHRIIKATVLSVGREVKEVKIGDSVLFIRLYFRRYLQGMGQTYYGWVDEQNLIGYPNEDEGYAFVGTFRGGTMIPLVKENENET